MFADEHRGDRTNTWPPGTDEFWFHVLCLTKPFREVYAQGADAEVAGFQPL